MSEKGSFIVTGGSQGFGAKLAEYLVQNGYGVALVARNAENLRAVEAKLKSSSSKGLQVSTHVADLSDEEQANRAIREVIAKHPNISCLVNNAGAWQGTKATSSLVKADVARSLDQNFYTAFNTTQALLKSYQTKTKGDLSIVNIGATSSKEGWDEVASFCIGKNALRVYSQALARELGPKGIHVAHVIVDGVLNNARTIGLNPERDADSYINEISLARTVVFLSQQDPSCWTFEMDVRPHNESW